MLFKVFIGAKIFQILFETMFGLIWVKIWAIEAQKVFWADSTPLHFIDQPESPP